MLELAHCIELVFAVYVRKLEHQPAPTNREEAFKLITTYWRETMLEYGASAEWAREYDAAGMTEKDGWKNLDADPCYWDNHYKQRIRIYVHRNGTIVIQRRNGRDPKILFSTINGVIARGDREAAEPL